MERLQKGDSDQDTQNKTATSAMIEIHTPKPQKIAVKVRIPIKEHPAVCKP